MNGAVRMLASASLALALALATTSCDPNPACDPGQHQDTGACYPNTPTGGGNGDGGSNDAAAGDGEDSGKGGSSACVPGPGHYQGFGTACTADTDCSCYAPTCATAPLNYCSHLECQSDTSLCPPGWSCTDISAFSSDPKATHICVKM